MGVKLSRKDEVRELMKLKPEEVQKKAGSHLLLCENLDRLHARFAEDILDEIKRNNEQNSPTRVILPVGPVGQYTYLTQMINEERVNLKNCWFFFMDEYCDDKGKAVEPNHPLSFRGIIRKIFIDRLDPATELNKNQIYFPKDTNIDQIDEKILSIGGIDTVYGGIGIHGHLAFNEPAPNIAELGSRRVKLNDFTITINAIRAQVGGNLENFPKEAFTIGMKQILSAKKIRLYCRNGTPYDWANTILRIALFGTPGDDYPVTYIRSKNYVIITDKDTLASPKNLL
jgi:glucosamine-6-phosphate deaminase